jgi:hypothetical protein
MGENLEPDVELHQEIKNSLSLGIKNATATLTAFPFL